MPQLVETPDYPGILNRIEQVRQEGGLSKSTFARNLGLTPQGYYYMEKVKKRPRLDVIIRLGRGAGTGRPVSLNWLLYGASPAPAPDPYRRPATLGSHGEGTLY